MNDESKRPPKGGSGEHPINVQFRKKLESFSDHSLEEMKEAAERLERLNKKSDRPSALPVIDVDADPDSKDETKP